MNIADNKDAGAALLTELKARYPENDFIIVAVNKPDAPKKAFGHMSTIPAQAQVKVLMQAADNLGKAMGFTEEAIDKAMEDMKPIKRILALLNDYPGMRISLTVIDDESDKAGNFSNMMPEENLHYMKENVLAIETYLATGEPH